MFCHFNGPQAVKKDKQLTPELVVKALRDLPRGSEIYFAATGKFFMGPQAVQHLHEAIRLGLSPLVLTHGQLFSTALLDLLVASGVRNIRISCDAIEPRVYAKIRRG